MCIRSVHVVSAFPSLLFHKAVSLHLRARRHVFDYAGYEYFQFSTQHVGQPLKVTCRRLSAWRIYSWVLASDIGFKVRCSGRWSSPDFEHSEVSKMGFKTDQGSHHNPVPILLGFLNT